MRNVELLRWLEFQLEVIKQLMSEATPDSPDFPVKWQRVVDGLRQLLDDLEQLP